MEKRFTWTAILICAALAACGGEEGDSNPTPMAGAGAGGTVAPVGGGGAGGALAGTGAAGTAGGMAPPVTCGTMTCNDPFAAIASSPLAAMFANLFPKPCCANEAMNQCGTKGAMSMNCRPPQPADPSCPAASLAFPIGMAPASCCAMTPEGGTCGIDGAAFDMGCVPFNEVRMGMAAAIVMVPAEKGCGPMPKPVTMTTAGSGGAGGATGGAGGAGGSGGAGGRSGAGGG